MSRPSLYRVARFRCIIGIYKIHAYQNIRNIKNPRISKYTEYIKSFVMEFLNQNLKHELHSVIKSMEKTIYVIKYTMSDGSQKYAKMRKNRYWSSNLHLECSLTKCKARISLKTVWPIQIDQVGKVFKPNAATSDEILTDIRSYLQIEHKTN